LISFETFTPGFRSVAGPAQAFEVRIIIGTPMSLSFDMVNGLSCYRTTVAQAVLPQVIVTLKDAGSLNIPLATIAALMPALTLLMLLPAFIAVLLAISRAIGCGAGHPRLRQARGISAGIALSSHDRTESALNLAVLDIDMTAAIKHSCNHLAFIIISRENVPYLSIIEINRDSLASG
jgi:hypothetical protein